MMITSSPPLNIMLQSIRKATKDLIRDFGEISRLQSSYRVGEFARTAYSRSRSTIINELKKYRQDYGIIFEDDRINDVKNNYEYSWFINPIDSRTNFLNALPYFTTSIALMRGDEAVAAVIDAPILRETFYVEKGKGAFAEDMHSTHMKMRVISKDDIASTIVDVNINANSIYNIKNLISKKAILRSMGAVYLGFACLSAGKLDVIIYSNLHKYKIEVGKLFISESGGTVSYNDNLFIGSSLALHDQCL